jgi:hypothetical protein
MGRLDRCRTPLLCHRCASTAGEAAVMAFHNPNPKIRALEQRNAWLRAKLFDVSPQS